jgi:hypothetical protein
VRPHAVSLSMCAVCAMRAEEYLGRRRRTAGTAAGRCGRPSRGTAG